LAGGFAGCSAGGDRAVPLLMAGVHTKDLILTIIARIGTAGGAGHVPGARGRRSATTPIVAKSAGVSTSLRGRAASFCVEENRGADINVNAIQGGVQ
jgi:hypothetical protein